MFGRGVVRRRVMVGSAISPTVNGDGGFHRKSAAPGQVGHSGDQWRLCYVGAVIAATASVPGQPDVLAVFGANAAAQPLRGRGETGESWRGLGIEAYRQRRRHRQWRSRGS